MIRLRTLGCVDLRGADGTPLDAVLAQPKRSALFFYLAVRGPGTFHRRDELLAAFWPELDDARARRTLNTSLSFLRTSLGQGVVAKRGDAEIGLDPERVWCDAAEFRRALERGERQRALDLYEGDLLPGVYVREAEGFERWVEEERARLRGLAAAAALAEADDRSREEGGEAAAEWLRRAAQLQPFDERVVRRLMETLAGGGNVAGALDAYESLVARLARDLDAPPSAETRALADAYREQGARPAPRRPAPTPPRHPEPPRTGRAMGRDRRVARVLGAVLAVAASAGGIALGYARSAPAADPGRIMVVPFVEVSPPPGFASGGTLAGEVAGRLSIPGRLSADVSAFADPADLGSARRAARRLGAGGFVVGALETEGPRTVLRATLYRSDGTRLGEASRALSREVTLEGDLDGVSLGLLAAHYAAAGVRELAEAAAGTTSIRALRSYLLADRDFRDGRYDAATVALQDAVVADEDFALAQYRLGVVSIWSGRWELTDTAFARADRLGDRLPEPERIMLVGRRTQDRALSEHQYREAVLRYPDFAEGWYELADLVFHNGQWGVSAAEARAAFERVLVFEPEDHSALIHLARLAAYEHRTDRLSELVARGLAEDGGGEWGVELRALRAFAARDAGQISASLAELDLLDDEALGRIGIRVLGFTEAFDQAPAILDLLAAPERAPELRALSLVVRGLVAATLGRPSEARATIRRAAALHPRMALMGEALLAVTPELPSDPREALSLSRRLALWESAPSPERAIPLGASDWLIGYGNPAVPALYEGLTALAGGDARAAERALRRADPTSAAGHLLAAQIARARGDARGALSILDDLSRAPIYEPLGLEAFVRGLALEDVGDDADAARYFGAMEREHVYSFVLAAPAHLRLAGIRERAGDATRAAEEYRAFISLWEGAEPGLQPRISEARARLASLGHAP